MADNIGTVSIQQALKTVQSGLTAQETALKTQTQMLFGPDGTPNGKIPLSTDAVIDLKTGQKLSDILEYNKPYVDSDLFVDMGLPSGVLWAKASIDLTTTSKFQEVDGAVSPFKYECSFFSWGNTDGHNPSSTSAFDYNWGGANEQEPYYDGQVYGDTPGNTLTGNIPPSMDAARVNLGAPWRMPTTEEYAELFANIDYVQADGATVIDAATTNKLVTVNSITGIYLKSKINGKLLFFPCSGYGSGQSWNGRGSYGYFWSSSLNSATSGRYLFFDSGGVNPQSSNRRFYGFAVRPVQ